MANELLTSTKILREALRVAHEKLTFIKTTRMEYDSQYAKSGAKIGSDLKLRLPNKYVVREGKNLNAQDTDNDTVTLSVATQKGVDMVFSSAEQAMELDDFSKNIIQPAMAVLCSNLESSYLNYVTKAVYQGVGTPGTLPTFLQIGQAKAKLNQSLAPKEIGNRHIQMGSVDMVGVVNEVKALFHDSTQISKQYLEGMVGRGMGLDWYENERIYAHTVGADVGGTTNDTLANGDNTITTSSVTMTVGDIFDMGVNCKAVHPETKATLAHNAQFVCTVATAGNSITFYPPIYSSGPKQNVSAMPASGQTITVIGTANGVYPQHLVYHKDAFAFASADLELPQGVHFAAREEMDGLSIRIIRQYDINSDNFPCRLDIYHGYEAIRPEWACRVYGA